MKIVIDRELWQKRRSVLRRLDFLRKKRFFEKKRFNFLRVMIRRANIFLIANFLTIKMVNSKNKLIELDREIDELGESLDNMPKLEVNNENSKVL